MNLTRNKKTGSAHRYRAARRAAKELKRRRKRQWLAIPMRKRKEIIATCKRNIELRKVKAGRLKNRVATES